MHLRTGGKVAKNVRAKRPMKTRDGHDKSRYEWLRGMLEDRRRELVDGLQENKRDARAGRAEVRDHADICGDEVEEDVVIALMQMRSETLQKIDLALKRLDQGGYGNCSECGGEISQARLMALPFAVRCKDCEEAWENVENRRHAAEARNYGFFPGAKLDDEAGA